jgi:hypothetical protein
MQRVSGSSTSTGISSLNVASGTRKEEVSISGNAFVPVRPPKLALSHAHSPAHSICFMPLADHSTPGTQVSFVSSRHLIPDIIVLIYFFFSLWSVQPPNSAYWRYVARR